MDAGPTIARIANLIGERGRAQILGALVLIDAGWPLFARLGITASRVATTRRPVCRACIDWSERRHHLAGSLGAALLTRLLELRWASRNRESRVVHFSTAGERRLREVFAG